MAKKNTSLIPKSLTKAVGKVAKKVVQDQKRKRPAFSPVLAILILLLCLGVYFYSDGTDSASLRPDDEYAAENEAGQTQNAEKFTGGVVALKPGTYPVQRVVDGDTLILDPKFLGVKKGPRVRFLGVDTPETVKPNHPVEPFGPEASAYTKRRVEENGNAVRLEFDSHAQDHYGRHLAYIWLGDSLLNEELIRNGLGRYVSEFPYSREMKDRFQRAELAAQREKLGIWSLPKKK